MSGLVFACCSAGRPDLLVKKTLRTLARGNYNQILWLIVPHEEVIAYSTAVQGNPILCMIRGCDKGLVKQRKFLRSLLLPNTEIVFIDDDVEAIKLKTPQGLFHCQNVIGLANYAFDAMAERGDDCLLAGVYPVANREWMSRTVTENNAYVVGALYFCKNDDRLKEPEHDECEDHYRALSEQQSFRPVLRFNFIGIQTQYFKNPGGMQNERSASHREAIVDRYASEFFQLVKAVTGKHGKPDLKYRKKPIPSIVQLPSSATSVPDLSGGQSTASVLPVVESGQCDLSGQEP